MQNTSLNLHQLLIYRQLLNNKVVQKVQSLINNLSDNKQSKTELADCYCDICYHLIKHAEKEYMGGNLWENYIITLILEDKNVFSLACEKSGKNINRKIYDLAVHDIGILQKLYNLDLAKIDKKTGTNNSAIIGNFAPSRVHSHFQQQYLTKIDDLKQVFSKNSSLPSIINRLADFYQEVGCGEMWKYPAFRWDKGLKGIKDPDPIKLEDLVGYEYQKEILTNNTKAFVRGKKVNNILLYGEKGTGKSSSVKALLNKYAEQGLRMIEVSKNNLTEFTQIVRTVKDRGLRFIIFIDDLSFEDFEVEYKHIKASLEGSIEETPDNVVIYVTSNRRHLIRENWSDRQRTGEEEVYISESYQEKLSFVDRFGIILIYQSPNQAQYLQIVEELARKNGIAMPAEELKKKAIQWEMRYHGRSGRTAQQFITWLLHDKSNLLSQAT